MVRLRQDNTELSAAANAQANVQIKSKLERLQAERDQIGYKRNLSWFLTEANVLLTGWRFKLRGRRLRPGAEVFLIFTGRKTAERYGPGYYQPSIQAGSRGERGPCPLAG